VVGHGCHLLAGLLTTVHIILFRWWSSLVSSGLLSANVVDESTLSVVPRTDYGLLCTCYNVVVNEVASVTFLATSKCY